MPEEVVLRCDAPECDEVGEYETFTLDGKTYEVILGDKHKTVLRELARWGRIARRQPAPSRRGKTRGTDEARLLSLVDHGDSRDGKDTKTPAQE